MQLHVLSGGAAQGLVQAVATEFQAATGLRIDGTFGAVGAMREKLTGGAPADLLLLTDAMIADLERTGHVVPGSAVPIGVVRTGVAVRTGTTRPAIADPDGLRAALAGADGIYFPDPRLATAGIHFAKVLRALGVDTTADPRLLTYPNGATAMRALAGSPLRTPIGCTQVTEILNTPGVDLVGLLPPAFELATVYTAGIAAGATHPEAARRLVGMLTAPAAQPHRDRLGFETA